MKVKYEFTLKVERVGEIDSLSDFQDPMDVVDAAAEAICDALTDDNFSVHYELSEATCGLGRKL